MQSQAHDVKYFSLKENEFGNNSQNSLEILVWITGEIQIPKYIYFLKLFKDNNTILKIYKNYRFTATSFGFHNTNEKSSLGPFMNFYPMCL